VAFNPVFLLKPILALSADKIRIDLKDSVSPCVIRQGEDFLCVVMPVRT
jgi:DNA polymerase-3 subunit beta